MKIFINKIVKDTVSLAFVSFILQALGLLMNVLISNKLGTASMGAMTLIFSFFGFIMVLANGNIFISTSRFVSEEIGAGCVNTSKIMRYSLTFSLSLSCLFMTASFIASGFISDILSAADISTALRLIALSLPPASLSSCIKGYFHGIRQIKVPCVSDCIEFSTKWIVLIISVVFLIDAGMNIYILISLSVLAGELTSCIYCIIRYMMNYAEFSKHTPCKTNAIGSVKKYLKLCFPIMISGYVQMIMSSLNEALVPVALLKSNASADRALSEYGMFEAIIMPTVFFPALVLGSLSNIIIPEIARAKSSQNHKRITRLTNQILKKTLMYAFFISGLFFMQGKNIGAVLCSSDSLVGNTLIILCPVIPFIYLEIVLEGILKGLGKQNFSTVNSLCEYAIRILCVIIFVHFYGFSGVLISYYASNIYSNIVRIAVVCRETKTPFKLSEFIIKPLVTSIFCCTVSSALTGILKPSSGILEAVIFITSACISFIAVYETEKKYFSCKDAKKSAIPC